MRSQLAADGCDNGAVVIMGGEGRYRGKGELTATGPWWEPGGILDAELDRQRRFAGTERVEYDDQMSGIRHQVSGMGNQTTGR
jgi:hypothetical protein